MKIKLFLIAIVAAGNIFAHKYYVSIAELEYNEEKNRIEGSLKMTAHDFELVLENKYDRKIDLEQVKDTSKVGGDVQAYLAEHFKLYSGGKQAVPNYLGREVTLRQDLFFYFTFTGVLDPKDVKLVNTVLFELFPQQQNIVHYKYMERTKSLTLVPSKIHGKIKFD